MRGTLDIHYFGTLLIGMCLLLAFLGAWWGTDFKNEKLERFVESGAVAMVALMRSDSKRNAVAPPTTEQPKP